MNKKEKQQIREDILRMMDNMLSNMFLLPDGWTDEITMLNGDTYKTYVDDTSRSPANRYVHIIYNKYHLTGIICYEIVIRRDKITLSDTDIFSELKHKIEIVYDIIKTVYKEKRSFIDNAEGIKSIRTKINSEKSSIVRCEKAIKEYEQQLKDLKKLKAN